MSHVNISEGKLYVSDKAYGKQELKQIDPLLFEDEKGIIWRLNFTKMVP